MPALPLSCPPLPELPPIFWNRVTEQLDYWQKVCAEAASDPPCIEEMRKVCIARIKTRLRRLETGKNPGRALFELADYVACLTVIDSRN